MPGRHGHALTLDEHERLEKMGVLSFRNDGVLEGHKTAGIHVAAQIIWAARNWGHWRWGILRSAGPQFVVPDTLQESAWVPIGPKLLLGANCPDAVLPADVVHAHNHDARQRFKRYYFGQDLSQA